MDQLRVEYEEENANRLIGNVKFHLDSQSKDLQQLDTLMSIYYSPDNVSHIIRGEINNMKSLISVCNYMARKIYNIQENSRIARAGNESIGHKCVDDTSQQQFELFSYIVFFYYNKICYNNLEYEK